MKELQYRNKNQLCINSNHLVIGETIRINEVTYRILSINNGYALLLREHVLDIRTFHIIYEPISYKDSSIREYLNHRYMIDKLHRDFLPLINQTKIYHLDGSFTMDRVFLLSKEEINLYLQNEKDRVAYDNFKQNVPWWLRSQKDLQHADFIYKNGHIGTNGDYHLHCGVRPAFWVTLDTIFDWEILNPVQIADDTYKLAKPYVGMKESDIEHTKCGPYYECLLFTNYHSYGWKNHLDLCFLRVSTEEGIVTSVMEMYPSCWNEDGTPKYRGIKFR